MQMMMMMMMRKDTDSVDSRDLEVINQLDNSFSVGVRGVAVSHLNTKSSTHQSYLALFLLDHQAEYD